MKRIPFAAVLAAGLISAAPADATYAGKGGELAAVRHEFDRGGRFQWDLQLFGPATRTAITCTRWESDFETPSGSCAHDPAFSRDGARMALELDGLLAVGAADGSAVTPLPALTDHDGEPAWSPDGKRLAFTGTSRGRRDVYVIGADGRDFRRLTRTGGRSPAWSSRGRIAYVSRGRVWTLDPASPRRRRVARGDHPDWSPSGRSLVYDHRRSAYLVATRRGAKRRLLARRAVEPAISPDARRLAFLRTEREDPMQNLSLVVAPLRRGRATVVGRAGELPVGSTWQTFRDPAWRPLR